MDIKANRGTNALISSVKFFPIILQFSKLQFLQYQYVLRFICGVLKQTFIINMCGSYNATAMISLKKNHEVIKQICFLTIVDEMNQNGDSSDKMSYNNDSDDNYLTLHDTSEEETVKSAFASNKINFHEAAYTRIVTDSHYRKTCR